MASSPNPRTPRRSNVGDRGIHVNFIMEAESDADGRMFLRTRGSRAAEGIPSLGRTPAAAQLTRALLDHLHINGGTWTSSATVVKLRHQSLQFLKLLEETHEVADLTDARLTPVIVWELILSTNKSGRRQRYLRTFLADAFADLRPDGDIFQNYLYGRALPVDVPKVQAYEASVAEEIERIARAHISEWYQRYRAVVQGSLGELPRNWLHITAAELVPEGTNACPSPYKVRIADLAAAMVLLALIDDKGPNLSTIQSYTCDSVERSNDQAGFVTGVKARNRQVLRTPAPAGGLYSYGGLLEFVTAATRVDRLFRQHSSDFDRFLFIATGSSKVMDGTQVRAWWRRYAPAQWDHSKGAFPKSVSFPKMRKSALLRGWHKGNGVIGQKPPTTRLYLADAIPDVILVPGLLDTQNRMANYWRAQTNIAGTIAQPGNDDDAALPYTINRLVSAQAVMDVGVACCSSNGQSPTDENKPCGLGPAACFVCPNGFRTPETIPGLLAAKEFTDNIRKYEPEEWLSGEAAILNSLAGKALDQFPRDMVSAVTAEEIANSRALIACIYVEGRSND